MGNLLAGVIGALVGLVGVAAGAWLQGRKEHQRWLRDQKLRAAIDFIGATGDLYDHRRRPLPPGTPSIDESTRWARAQDGRSALYLLCDQRTVELAETLITSVRHLEPAADGSHNDEVLSLLRDLVRRLRAELGAGAR
jgi:hypothetical protein